MEKHTCCQEGTHGFLLRKLGRCTRCLRGATYGTTFAWMVWVGLAFGQALTPLRILAGLVATSFTLLLFAHLVALLKRLISEQNPTEASVSPERSPASWLRRREFLGRVFQAGTAVLVAALAGRGEEAQAQGGTTVTGTIVNQNGVPCAGIPVTLFPNPPCELVPATRHRRAMCRQNTARENPVKTHTGKDGKYTFTGVVANKPFVICVCGGRCRFVNGVCQLDCDGPTTTVASGAAGTTATVLPISLQDCKCGGGT